MSATITFALAIHNHQPVGNFDFVIEGAIDNAYHPFLEVLERFPDVRVSLHYCGLLLDWFKEKRPDIIERIRSLVERRQVELLGGGYYEPILPILPVRDQVGQMNSLSEALEATFGSRPRGLWLAERVWEPQLPGPITAAGMEYVVVDDGHFKAMGFKEDQLFGHYRTEDQGAALSVFPILKPLRYAIPFAPVSEAQSLLTGWASLEGRPVAVMGDDGEKFGTWPGTHQRVYEEGWLEEFFAMLTETPEIETATLSEILDSHPSLGMVYLPMCSYEEMLGWQYPSDVTLALERLREELHDRADLSPLDPFFRGGMWRNFLVKYREANHLHKRMWRVSTKLASVHPKGRDQELSVAEATEALYKGQCNDGYWHGIFGGLYLPHLRTGLYEQLIKAETIVDTLLKGPDEWIDVEQTDFDMDGREEVLVTTPKLGLIIHPDEGGMVSALDYRPLNFNCINSLQRRKEAYHERMLQAAADAPESEEAKTIHDQSLTKISDLNQGFWYDWYPRGCFCEHLLDEGVDWETYSRASFEPLVNLCPAPYEVTIEEESGLANIVLIREAPSRANGAILRVEKRLTVDSKRATVLAEYRLSNVGEETLGGLFALEWNFGLLAGWAPDRYYRVDGKQPEEPHLASKGPLGKAACVELVDEWRGLTIAVSMEPETTWWRFPVETISQSESGLERIYQSSTLVALWPLNLGAAETRELRGAIDLTSPNS